MLQQKNKASPERRITEGMLPLPPKPINLLKCEYKLVGKLGTGGFSLVYSMESVDSGRMCAAKFQVRIVTSVYP